MYTVLAAFCIKKHNTSNGQYIGKYVYINIYNKKPPHGSRMSNTRTKPPTGMYIYIYIYTYIYIYIYVYVYIHEYIYI